MKLPARIGEICEALYERNRELAHSENDSDRRTLTKMIVEQVVLEFPGQSYGWKARSAALAVQHPSKDTIAQRQPDGRLFAWDWQSGTTRRWQNPDHLDITGQFFIDVSPVNHLGVTAPALPDPVDSGPANDTGLSAQPTIDQLLVDLEARLKAHIDAAAEKTRTEVVESLSSLLAGVRDPPQP
jgi:hypothetical protein